MMALNSLGWELMVKIMHFSLSKECVLLALIPSTKFMNPRPPGLIGDPLREPQGKNRPCSVGVKYL